MAAENLGVRIFPSNFEVAIELDRLAEELEGEERIKRLIRMRFEALEIMRFLRDFHPKLIGSVWRGTVCRESDIDIIVYSDTPKKVVEKLIDAGLKILGVDWRSTTKNGEVKRSLHIRLSLESGDEVEVVVKSLSEMNEVEICDIYGDEITGLNIKELERVLSENPTKKFIPS